MYNCLNKNGLRGEKFEYGNNYGTYYWAEGCCLSIKFPRNIQPPGRLPDILKIFPDCSILIVCAKQYVLTVNVWLHLQINTLLTSVATIQLRSGQVVMSE